MSDENNKKDAARRIGRAIGRGAIPGVAALSALKKQMKSSEKDDESISDFAGGAKAGGVMKANSGLEVDADIFTKRYDKKRKKYTGSKESELHAGYKGDYLEDSGEDRAEKRALKETMQESGIKFTGAKYGKMIMSRGCKMGRHKKTKIL